MKQLLSALALAKVDGVHQIEVSYEQRAATVTFDDAKASVPQLTRATEDAGHPSSVKR